MRLNRVFGLAARQGVLAIVDQSIVSGSRFLLTVIVGRAAGADELGIYAVGFSLVVLGLIVQDSLLTTPYTMLSQGDTPEDRRTFAGSVLVQAVAFATIAALISAIAGLALMVSGNDTWGAVLLAVAVAGPWVLLQGCARSVAYAHLLVRSALGLDVALALVQVCVVVLIAQTRGLSGVSTLAALGAAGAVSSTAWLVSNRSLFTIDRSDLRSRWSSNWAYGKWMLGSQPVRALRATVAMSTLSSVSGIAAAGAYAAAATVVVAANPLVLGTGAVLAPKAAQAFAQGGRAELGRVVAKVSVLMSAVFVVYVIVVVVAGEWFISGVFDDSSFDHSASVIILLAVSLAIRSIRIGWNNGLKAMSAHYWNFWAGVIELIVLVATMIPLARRYGIIGVAYGELASSSVGTIVRWAAFRHVIAEPRPAVATAERR